MTTTVGSLDEGAAGLNCAQRLVVPPSTGGSPNGPTTTITATWDVPAGATGPAIIKVSSATGPSSAYLQNSLEVPVGGTGCT